MIPAMPRSRPPYLHRETSRHGKGVWYVRIDKGKRIRLRAEFGTPAFTAAYNAAVIGKLAEPAVPFATTKSVGWAIQRYRESAAWVKLSRATRRQRESILRSIAESAGRQPITRVDKTAVENGTTRRLDRPHAARHFLQTMRGLFQWAVKAKHVHNDPTAGLKTIRPRTDGHPPWPQAWCDRFEAKWPLGTRERVTYDVMRYTGLRLGDAARLGLPHVKNGVAVIRTEKNGEIVTIPILPPLKASLDAGPIGELTYIAGARGKPLTEESCGNWFRQACRAASVPGSAHGLRKTAATIAADNGATEAELEALFGWRGGDMASLYTRSANRARLAHGAASKLLTERDANIYSRTSSQGAGGKQKSAETTTPKKFDGGPGRTRTSNQAVMSRWL